VTGASARVTGMVSTRQGCSTHRQTRSGDRKACPTGLPSRQTIRQNRQTASEAAPRAADNLRTNPARPPGIKNSFPMRCHFQAIFLRSSAVPVHAHPQSGHNVAAAGQ
jgi:hypothetical protein